MTRIPIACTLTVDQAVDRGGEWQGFLAERVVEVERAAGAARLRLHDGPDALLAAADLAEREKACCAFFTFSIELDGGARWLRIEAPTEADAVLDQLVAAAG